MSEITISISTIYGSQTFSPKESNDDLCNFFIVDVFVRMVSVSQTKEERVDMGQEKQEVLIVASKVKAYIKAKSGMNTSASVMSVLSDRIRLLCDRAIEIAGADGRKTVMDRDFGGQE